MNAIHGRRVRKMHGMRIIRPKDDSTYQVDVTNCVSYHFYRVIGTLTSSQQFIEPDFARSFANIKPLNRLEGVRD